MFLQTVLDQSVVVDQATIDVIQEFINATHGGKGVVITFAAVTLFIKLLRSKLVLGFLTPRLPKVAEWLGGTAAGWILNFSLHIVTQFASALAAGTPLTLALIIGFVLGGLQSAVAATTVQAAKDIAKAKAANDNVEGGDVPKSLNG